MKRLSSGVLALLATLLLAIPADSQAFFGFFGGGFSFGFGGGWGGNWWGPGYWHNPWYYNWYRPYWAYPYGYGYGHYPYYGLYSPYIYPYAVTVPTVTVPETSKSK